METWEIKAEKSLKMKFTDRGYEKPGKFQNSRRSIMSG
jgi:hypothetical protein